MTKNNFNYSLKKRQLVELLDWFEAGDADLDKALENYNKAEVLIAELQDYLKDTEKKIKITVNK
jgi:exodeoxyribonuclease VII small subunit